MTNYLIAEIENMKEAARESDRLLSKFIGAIDTQSLLRHRKILAGIYRITNHLESVMAELERLAVLTAQEAAADLDSDDTAFTATYVLDKP